MICSPNSISRLKENNTLSITSCNWIQDQYSRTEESNDERFSSDHLLLDFPRLSNLCQLIGDLLIYLFTHLASISSGFVMCRQVLGVEIHTHSHTGMHAALQQLTGWEVPEKQTNK